MSLWFRSYVVAMGFVLSAVGAPVPRMQPEKWETLEMLGAHAGGSYVLVGVSEEGEICAPYKELLIDVANHRVSFRAREFWWRPEISPACPAQFNLVNAEDPPAWRITTFKDGVLRRVERNQDLTRVVEDHSLSFSAKNNRVHLAEQLNARAGRCIYAHQTREEFAKLGDAKIDPVLKELEKYSGEVKKSSSKEMEAFCGAVQRDKYLGQAEPYREFCRLDKTTEEHRSALLLALEVSGDSLAVLKVGLRDPEKAYGETRPLDRLYRVLDNRAVYGGFDLVQLFHFYLSAASKKERCEDQKYTKSLCREIGLAQAAFVIQYHKD